MSALAALFVAPASAAAMAGPANGLSPRLAVLARPSVRSASERVQAKKLGLAAEGPGSLLRRGNRVLVYVRFDRGAAAHVKALKAANGQVVDTSRRYQTVTVAARPAALRGLADTPGVAGVTPVLTPVVAATCPSGEIVSEGVEQLNAGTGTGEARGEFPGIDGSGVTVGILSDSFDQATEAADGSGEAVATHAEEDEESGDLPGPNSPCTNKTEVDVLEPEGFGEEAADEGRGMAQIVHDVAPGATIKFASAFNGETAFAQNIGALAAAGAKVIADDVFYFEEPFFQDGPVAVAANEAVAGEEVAYFSSAGNDNIIDAEGHDIASWETPEFRDSGGCPQEVQALPGANGTHCLDFNPGSQTDRTFGIAVEPGEVLSVDLQWDEPWFGVGTDLDAFLLDAEGRLIPGAIAMEDNIGVSQQPTEILQWENESEAEQTVQLVINRFAGGDPRLKFGLLENGGGVAATEYPRSTGEDVVGPTVFGHSGAASVVGVGAIRFNTKSHPEGFSSRGPVRHDFGMVDTATEDPAAAIPPQIISKPDVTATDCNLTTFFAFFATIAPETEAGWHFCGTSAAAPHAAGVAALMLDEEGSAEPDEIRVALQESALEVGTGSEAFGPCAVGGGLIDALGAIEDLLTPPGAVVPSCETPASEEPSGENARAPGNWGSEAPPSPPPPTGQTTTPTPESKPLPAPSTFFKQKPPKLVRTHSSTARVVFRFGSDQTAVTFACRIDGGLFRPCPERLVRRFGLGSHSLRVVALNPAGEGDATAALYRFRVERIG
jgi:subtilisin family serine protease